MKKPDYHHGGQNISLIAIDPAGAEIYASFKSYSCNEWALIFWNGSCERTRTKAIFLLQQVWIHS